MDNSRKLVLSENDKLLKDFIVFGLGFTSSLIFLILNLKKSNSNLKLYIAFILVFVISSLIYNFLLSYIKIIYSINKSNTFISNAIGLLIIFISSFLLLYVYLHELNTFDAPGGTNLIYHGCNMLSLILMFCTFLLVVYMVENYKGIVQESNSKANSLYYAAFAIGVAFLCAYVLYTPNIFSTFYNLYHNNAYFNSVYRVMQGAPRTTNDTGIYGFYGLILAPFVMLLGGDIGSFYIVIGIVEAISALCIAYSLHVFVKTTIIKVFGVILLPVAVMSYQWGIYPQLYPHRVVFPCILIAYMSFLYKRNLNSFKWTIIGYILTTFAIIWSTEVGIVCIITWMAYTMYRSIATFSLINFKLYKDMLVNILLSVLSFLSAVVLVSIINIIMGGSWISIQDFLFPLLSKDFISGDLTIKLEYDITAWILVISIFFLFLIHALVKTKLSPINTGKINKDNVFFGVSILEIGQMTYYMNRPAYGNLKVCYYGLVLLLCIFTDWCFIQYKNNRAEQTKLIHSIFRASTYVFITSLVVMVGGGIANSFNLEIYKYSYEYRNYEEVKGFANQLQEDLPKDTLAIGSGVAELYSCLGWDTGYYPIDFSDVGILPDAAKEINQKLDTLEVPVLLFETSLEKLNTYSPDGNKAFYDHYKLEKTYTFYDQVYNYYVPK